MPLYDQSCNGCGMEFECLALSYDSPRPCPKCGSIDTDQLITAASFRIAKRQFEMKRGPSHNPYDGLVLQHIRDEHGKPVKVNSERELHAAESKYGFVHNASWGTEKEPPQHEATAGDITRNYKWKWAKDPEERKRRAAQGVSTGVAANADETLAYHPNPV